MVFANQLLMLPENYLSIAFIAEKNYLSFDASKATGRDLRIASSVLVSNNYFERELCCYLFEDFVNKKVLGFERVSLRFKSHFHLTYSSYFPCI
jgi:hypothetical protein